MIFSRFLDDLTAGPDDEHGVEKSVSDDLGPPGLALGYDISFILFGQFPKIFSLLPGDIDKELSGGESVRQIENLICETRQCSFCQVEQFDRHVDIHHGDSGVNILFNNLQVLSDVAPVGDAVSYRGQPNGHVRSNWFFLWGRRVSSLFQRISPALDDVVISTSLNVCQ
jgi:hypothetical protein